MQINSLIFNPLSANRQNTQTASNEYYIAQAGDSVWKIANANKISLSELIAANPQIADPNLIFTGQKIRIPSPNTTADSMEDEVAHLVNAQRQKQGIAALRINRQLGHVARYKSENMKKNNFFDHISPTFGTPFEMIRDFGINFNTAAENIAKGQQSAQGVVLSWMNSQSHRANILNPDFTETGIGYTDGSMPYWTQMFIG